METRSAKRRRLLQNPPPHDGNDEDRISELPDDVLHHILSFVSIDSAARASTLSRRWRNVWYSFPDLDFTTFDDHLPDESYATFASKSRRNTRTHYARGAEIAARITSLLEKHSDIRALRFRAHLTFSQLSSLIHHALKHNVQDLDIEVHTTGRLNFPRSVISSSTLRVFRLESRSCGLRLPPLQLMKGGFRSLSELTLSQIVLNDQPSLTDLFTDSSFPSLKKLDLESCIALNHLRVECSALEEFNLTGCVQLDDLGIRARKLKRLHVSWCFDPYSVSSRVMIEAPNLEIMSWAYNAVTEECIVQDLQHLREAFVCFFPLLEEPSAAKIRSRSNFLAVISRCRNFSFEGSGPFRV